MLSWVYRFQMSKTHSTYNYTAAQMLPRIYRFEMPADYA